MEKTSLLV